MLNLIHAMAAGCAFFLSFLVFTVRRETNTIANRWLAAFLCLLGCFMIDDSLYVFGIYSRYPALYGFAALTVFALAPTLYLSVVHFVSVDKKFNPEYWWHLAPFFAVSLLSLPILCAPDTLKIKLMESDQKPPDMEAKVMIGLILLQIFIYWFLSLRKLHRHRRNIVRVTASILDYDLKWLLWVLYGIGGMMLIWWIDLWFYALDENASWATPVYLVGIAWIGYFALRQKEIYPFTATQSTSVAAMITDDEEISVSFRKSPFTEERLAQLKSRLLVVMEQEKPYLDPDLNLPGLASLMQLSVHEMSHLVNEGFQENFAQFINRYRVEESKRLLHSEKYAHLSMVGIAFESGFNSKTAFNTAFKKLTGVSPSAFRAGQQEG